MATVLRSVPAPSSPVDRRTLRRRPFGTFFRIACLLAIGVAAAGWIGADRVPTPAASGYGLVQPRTHILEPDAGGAHRSFRVVTFNIHSGRGADGTFDLNRTADCLSELMHAAGGTDPASGAVQRPVVHQTHDDARDLVGNGRINGDAGPGVITGLNEVQGTTWGGLPNQAESLGDLLGAAWLFAPTEHRFWRDHFGNGAMATIPVASWLRFPLPSTGGKGFRNALLLSIEPDGQPAVRVLITHLDRTHDRALQLAAVTHLFLSLAPPAILMGDLNTTRDDQQVRRLLARHDVQDAVPAVQGNDNPGRIDWILVRGLRVLSAGIVERGASDHPAVWADLAPVTSVATPARPASDAAPSRPAPGKF